MKPPAISVDKVLAFDPPRLRMTVPVRPAGHSAKRLNYLTFMVNEMKGRLAARIGEWVARHSRMDWEVPACGVIRA